MHQPWWNKFGKENFACTVLELVEPDQLLDPLGNEVDSYNLHEFCREHGLNARAMMALADPNHKLKQHKGWTWRPKEEDHEQI